jgi:hypothetical protein
LNRIVSVQLRHGPHALPLAWLLLGWLSSRLGWEPKKATARHGNEIKWLFTSPEGPIQIAVHRGDDGPPRIERLQVEWRAGDGHPAGSAEYRHEGHHIRHFPSDPALRPSSIPTMEQRLEQMVAAQLAHRAGDELFKSAIDFSEAMAKVVKVG